MQSSDRYSVVRVRFFSHKNMGAVRVQPFTRGLSIYGRASD
jgi:hypothetical protein